MIKILSIILGFGIVFLVEIIGNSNGVDYNLGESRLIGLGIVSIFLGVVFGVDAFYKKRKNQKTSEDFFAINCYLLYCSPISFVCATINY